MKCGIIIVVIGALLFLLLPLSIGKPKEGEPFKTSLMAEQEIAVGVESQWVNIENVSTLFICTVVKSEDRTFFRHRGFEFGAIYRAIKRSFNGDALVGASTITQQVAKNILVGSKRSWFRKFMEALYSVRLERTYSKLEILEYYLNSIKLGDDLWGISNASKYYFNKSAKDLDLDESLFLAGILARPTKRSDPKQVERIKSVYKRINYQLYTAGISNILTWQHLENVWPVFEIALVQNLNPIKISSAKPERIQLSLEDVLSDQCGLDRELDYALN